MATTRRSIAGRALQAMGLFGGVQIAGIACSIIRTKLVAMWLGTVGVGLFGLFNNALEMLNTATNLGVRNSSVRDLSQAEGDHDSGLAARLAAAVRRWSLWLGLAGSLITILLAPLLSLYTFETTDYLWHFVALSVAVLAMSLTNGEYAVLQGSGRLRRLAEATLWGTITGLVISIPMFYWMGEASVVPSIIAYALSIAGWAFALRHRDYPMTKMSARETWDIGRGFVMLGIFMTVGTMVSTVATYAFNAWLNVYGGTAVVGLYQAGYTLVNKYTGLVLTALGMEYYPRLSRVAQSPMRLRVMVSQELNVAMLVMAPVVALFIVLRSPMVWLLYSNDFMPILEMIAWGIIGAVWRTVSWCLAFVILARGDGRTYLWTESLSAVAGLLLHIGCYQLWGLTGLGIAFMLWYVVYTAIVAVVYVWRYGLRVSWTCLGGIVATLGVGALTLLLVENGLWLGAWAVVVVTSAVCLWRLWRLWKK